MISGEASNTNIIEFGLTRMGLEPIIYRTRVEHTNHYTTDVVYWQRKKTDGGKIMRTKTDKIIRINNNIFSVDVTDEDQTHNIRNTLILFCCTYLVAKSVDASYLLDK